MNLGPGNQKGVALLITVMTLTLLTALTVEFHRATWQKLLAADTYKTRGELQAIAISGVNIATALLEKDFVDNNFDSALDDWAAVKTADFEELFPDGTLVLTIEDLSGKLPINSLAEQAGRTPPGETNPALELQNIFLNLLTSGVFNVEGETEAENILDAIIDWIDTDDKESDFGAESGYYQSLEQPYDCRNAPIQYIEELLLIKGISPELLYGDGEREGLVDYITIYGDDGRININSADRLLIKSFDPTIGDELLERFDDFRKMPENKEKLSSPNWYTETSGWPGDIVLSNTITTTKSSFFQIRSTGISEDLSRTIVIDLQRDSDGNLITRKRIVEQQ
ncbi:type II secretion system minor pseudopilin [Desulforhopalus singaporensis]|uniref:General secretion pathway protein K n=1 Tax=Desulforhopalus singaporensis TaxID=91360 RepID=A0A1H0M265_9BACT|nr:type II secretion system protein GspK [Desulforhopalus singaporensis]SDO74306.1 general secretion pathway protein K [Desulforhopalus singaporensis]